MKSVLFLLAIALIGAAAWVLGPREQVAGPVDFDPEDIDADVDRYLFRTERETPGLNRGAQKQVLWATPARKRKTPLAIVYVHGFSASLQEIRPVPDLLARQLGANLFYTRLTGHARDGAALARAGALDWRADMAEALEIGRRIGEKVIVIGTSMGGALATLAMTDPALSRDVGGVVLISPAYRFRESGSGLLTWPFARSFVPMVAGKERFFVPHTPEHGKWWTTRYPTEAVIPVAALAKAAREAPLDRVRAPALFLFSDSDTVVDPRETRRAAARWGGRATVVPVETGPEDDPDHHVIAGEILSPGRTEPTVASILDWLSESGLQE